MQFSSHPQTEGHSQVNYLPVMGDSNNHKPHRTSDKDIPYLHNSSVHPFRGFLGPKKRVRIRIDGALDAHAKLETTISLSVGSL